MLVSRVAVACMALVGRNVGERRWRVAVLGMPVPGVIVPHVITLGAMQQGGLEPGARTPGKQADHKSNDAQCAQRDVLRPRGRRDYPRRVKAGGFRYFESPRHFMAAI